MNDTHRHIAAWARSHSDVTPIDGTDRNSPTFGDLRAVLAQAGLSTADKVDELTGDGPVALDARTTSDDPSRVCVVAEAWPGGVAPPVLVDGSRVDFVRGEPGTVAPDGSVWALHGPGRWSSGIVGLAEGQREAAEAAGWRVSRDGRTASRNAGVEREDQDDAYGGPTPQEQRERFERLIHEPAPTAAQVKVALENLDKHARRFAQFEHHGHALELNNAATVLDSLAAHRLNLEITAKDLGEQLDRIADQAKPIDGSDVASLVQSARNMADRLDDPRNTIGDRPVANMIRKLVGALNDQARKLAALEPPADTSPYLPEGTAAEAVSLILRSMDPRQVVPASEWNVVMSRLRYYFTQERKDHAREAAELRLQLDTANGLIDEAAPIVRDAARWQAEGWPYTDAQREAARVALSSVRIPSGPRPFDMQGACVDAVAKALGMRRAEA